MQYLRNLSDMQGGCFKIKWMYLRRGLQEAMKSVHIEPGSDIRVIMNYGSAVLIGAEHRRFIIDGEIAERIKV